mmetsp:Transcript_167377/g.406843  ORF Transcript_167377/g.406843 Transcript_167377/m.406843 type:complete len:309 (-) Transcript_167377:19-945(-)
MAGDSAQAAKDVVAGTVGGIFQVLSAMPFDTVKVRMQVDTVGRYKGTLDCVRQTAAQEGFSAFYKGTLSPLVGVGACVAIQFGVLESAKRAMVARRQAAGRSTQLSPAEFALAGALAGAGNALVSTPVEHVRIRMQLQTTSAPATAAKTAGAVPGASTPFYNSTVDCFRQIRARHGWPGVYKGFGATLARESLGYAGYFLVYEMAMRAMTGDRADGEPLPVGKILLAGGLAGFGMWVPAFPLDVIKSKLQGESLENPTFRTLANTARRIAAEEGTRGFFKGFTPCMLRAMPVNAVTFLGFELAMKMMS